MVRREPSASRGGALEYWHPIRRLALVALAALCAFSAAVVLVPPAGARTGELQQNRDKARAIAAEIAGLDAEIGAAVNEYSRATQALDAVRRQIRANQRQQRLAYKELGLARATLAARAVTMYKHEDVTTMDAVFGAADLSDLVTQLTMVRTLARCDRDVLRTIETTKRELADRAAALDADEKTQHRLVETCREGLTTIRSRLDERRAALAGVRSDISRLVADAAEKSPDPTPTVEPPQQGGGGDDGSGPWWSLIQSAAASNDVSARGMYRLMMIESGGSATIVGPGGYYGLFQYAPTTWKGSWNPWRSSAITDGAAQIKATALAIRQGYGHAWWDPSYTWAFQGD
jgi:peptidoglycan hydrolase CwlO-like protein